MRVYGCVCVYLRASHTAEVKLLKRSLREIVFTVNIKHCVIYSISFFRLNPYTFMYLFLYCDIFVLSSFKSERFLRSLTSEHMSTNYKTRVT